MGSDGVPNQEKFTDVIQFFWIPGFQINCRDPERLRSWKNLFAFSPRPVSDLLLLFRERSAHFYFIIETHSLANAHSLLPSQLYLLCCSSRSLHSYFIILTSCFLLF